MILFPPDADYTFATIYGHATSIEVDQSFRVCTTVTFYEDDDVEGLECAAAYAEYYDFRYSSYDYVPFVPVCVVDEGLSCNFSDSESLSLKVIYVLIQLLGFSFLRLHTLSVRAVEW